MSNAIEQKRRELFESVTSLPDGVVWCVDGGKYIGMNYWLADFGWSVFNAALDAVEIELEPDFDSETDYQDGFTNCLASCRAAIESTGLGLKVLP